MKVAQIVAFFQFRIQRSNKTVLMILFLSYGPEPCEYFLIGTVMNISGYFRKIQFGMTFSVRCLMTSQERQKKLAERKHAQDRSGPN